VDFREPMIRLQQPRLRAGRTAKNHQMSTTSRATRSRATEPSVLTRFRLSGNSRSGCVFGCRRRPTTRSCRGLPRRGVAAASPGPQRWRRASTGPSSESPKLLPHLCVHIAEKRSRSAPRSWRTSLMRALSGCKSSCRPKSLRSDLRARIRPGRLSSSSSSHCRISSNSRA
jgi:hypothetical protein